MTYKQIFNEWTTKDLPHRRKVQVAEQILLIAKSNHLTPEEKKKVEEARNYLLHKDD